MNQRDEFAKTPESTFPKHAQPGQTPTYRPSNQVDLQLAARAGCSYVPPQAAVKLYDGTAGRAGANNAVSTPGGQRSRVVPVAIWLLGVVIAGFAGYSFDSVRSHMSTTLFTVKIRADERALPKPQAEPALTTTPVATPVADGLAYTNVMERRPVTPVPVSMSQGRSMPAVAPAPPAAEAAPVAVAPQRQRTQPVAAIGLLPERPAQAPATSAGASETAASGRLAKPQSAGSNAMAGPAKPACSEALRAMQLCNTTAQ
jgi:hypothetical protein